MGYDIVSLLTPWIVCSNVIFEAVKAIRAVSFFLFSSLIYFNSKTEDRIGFIEA